MYFDCDQRSPCNKENIDKGLLYHPHENKNKFVQCGGVDLCWEMACQAGLVWNQANNNCDWPAQ